VNHYIGHGFSISVHSTFIFCFQNRHWWSEGVRIQVYHYCIQRWYVITVITPLAKFPSDAWGNVQSTMLKHLKIAVADVPAPLPWINVLAVLNHREHFCSRISRKRQSRVLKRCITVVECVLEIGCMLTS